MGVVYLGRHEALGRRVVVKVLRPDMSRKSDMVQRFFNEAQAATAINNPGIAQVFDFGVTPDGQTYFVMELLEGETLTARLRSRRLDPAECCRIGRQIANVLQAAHAAGITHRDLKPDNLFLVPDPEVNGGERVKVLDFGLAKLANEARPVKTRTGIVMGTPAYMSPEQCRGIRNADARSDIYSLGCILFKMACGRAPFVGELADVIVAHVQEPAPDPREFAPNLPAELAALISKMLAKHPDSRPQTMAAVSGAIDEILSALGGARAGATTLPPGPPSGPPPIPPRASASLPRPPTPLPTPPPDDPPSLTDADPIPMTLDDTLLAPPARPSDLATMPLPNFVPPAQLAPAQLAPGSLTPVSLAPGSLAPGSLTPVSLTPVSLASGSLEPQLAPLSTPAVGTGETGEVSAFARLRAHRRSLVIGGLVAAGALVLVLVLVLALGGSSSAERPRAGGEGEAAVSAPTRKVDDLEAECQAHLEERKWTALERCADALKPLDPDRAAQHRLRAVQETMTASRVAAVEAALRNNNLKRAKVELQYVWPESVEHSDIQRKYALAEAQAIADLAAELARVRDTDCKKYNALLERERAKKPPHVTEEAARRTTCTPPAKCDVRALASKARAQHDAGQHVEAFMSHEAAYACSPTPARALKAFTVACTLRNVAKARSYWRLLAPAARAQAVGACVRNGISKATLNAP